MSVLATSWTYDELKYALNGLQVSGYIDTACFAVLAYDYCLTFEDERSLMWSSPMSSSKVLFLLTRYLPFVDLSITASHHLRYNMSQTECLLAYRSAGWLINLGIIIAEMVLWQRTRAIWGCTRIATILLSIWFCASIIPDLVLFTIFMDSVKFTELPAGRQGCLVTTGSTLLISVWIILMIYEAGILIALVVRGFQYYRQRLSPREQYPTKTKLYDSIFKDGSIFYVYIFALSVANVIIITHFSPDLESMLATAERVAHAILTGRLVLTLRKSANEDNGLQGVDTHEMLDTTLRFGFDISLRETGDSNTTSTSTGTQKFDP